MSEYGVFSGPYFPAFRLNTERYSLSTPYFSVFSPNAGKYGPEKTPYLDTFHAVITYKVVRNIQTMTNQCLSDVHSRTCILQYFFNNVIPCQSITNILIWNYVREQLLKELRNCILTARRVIIILFNAAFSRSAVSTIFLGN